ncbi:MAG: phosphatidylserine decarboxylase [Rickettsiales bacterium]|nr:phosphatidylserine decarboxylase [Rickettsiales bacterium]
MTQKTNLFRLHKDGYLFIGIFVAITALAGMFQTTLGWICGILTLWCVAFFRDPDRVTPENENYIISPADGVVQKIEKVEVPPELAMKEQGERVRISIFLGLLDVHVNRVPVSGTITKIKYVNGRFFYAALDKASEHNERNYVVVSMKNGKNVIFTQIAGVVARRILCEVKKGKEVSAGERYGLIRFGSRMDIYLPKGEVPKVVEEQRVIAGETILSVMGDKNTISGVIR